METLLLVGPVGPAHYVESISTRKQSLQPTPLAITQGDSDDAVSLTILEKKKKRKGGIAVERVHRQTNMDIRAKLQRLDDRIDPS